MDREASNQRPRCVGDPIRAGSGSRSLRTRRARAAMVLRVLRRMERASPAGLRFPVLLVALAFVVALGVDAHRSAGEGGPEGLPEGLEGSPSELVGAELPVEINDRVERWIHRFLTDQRASFEQYLAREGLYGGMIRAKLREREMPEDLLYLAMIESGFSPWATSPVQASGVWQFMGATARQYGLRIDMYVDERRDPVRATDAALDYLEELHDEFGSWYLAAAAYNAGPNRVARALDRLGGPDPAAEADLYWAIIEHLPLETREYVPKILAAALLARQAEHFGFRVEQSLPYLFDRVAVPGGTALHSVANVTGVSSSLIRDLNPHVVRGVTPPGEPFLIRVPQGTSHAVVASLES